MEKIVIFSLIPIMLGLWFWAISDIAKSRFKNTTMNLIWLLIVIFFPVIGSILYLFLRKTQIQKEPRKFNPKFNH